MPTENLATMLLGLDYPDQGHGRHELERLAPVVDRSGHYDQDDHCQDRNAACLHHC